MSDFWKTIDAGDVARNEARSLEQCIVELERLYNDLANDMKNLRVLFLRECNEHAEARNTVALLEATLEKFKSKEEK